MHKNKVVSADEAIARINTNDVIATTGFVQSCIPEMLHAALENRFVESKAPRDLTLIMCAGAGDSRHAGHRSGPGRRRRIGRRVVAGHRINHGKWYCCDLRSRPEPSRPGGVTGSFFRNRVCQSLSRFWW